MTLSIKRQAKSSKKIKKLLIQDLFHKIVGLSKTQRYTLNYIIFMSQKVRSLYMSQSHIARVVGCTREWANKCLSLLDMLGLIHSKRRRYYEGWRTNIYGLKVNFFDPSIAYQLYTLLSCLRTFSKKFTQLENDRYSNIISSTNSKIDDQKRERKGIEDPPKKVDVMSWSLQDILNLRKC